MMIIIMMIIIMMIIIITITTITFLLPLPYLIFTKLYTKIESVYLYKEGVKCEGRGRGRG